ncbi:MAG: ABC transporter substrate-binding protein [Chloroflexota bacterium]|nr:ABC transporter substrate-binding protein [Chloroflexota bacterium]
MASTINRRPLRLIETFRSVFYTPIYVSVAGGFFEKEGLDVDFKTCPPEFAHPLSALNRGGADIAQSGIMRSIISSDWGAETVPMHFAKINSRDGFFVLSRTNQEPFLWESLKGAKLIPVGFSPMPWASLQFALRRHGVEPDELDLVTGLSFDDGISAFREGHAEYIHVPQPAAELLLDDGIGHVAAALGPENGHLAYSSFAATNQFLDSQPETVQRFTIGFANALEWLAANNAQEVGQAIASFFPEVRLELVVKSVARLKAQDNWPTDPVLAQPEYENLHDILVAAGLAKERQPYSKVVRTNIVETALSSRN